MQNSDQKNLDLLAIFHYIVAGLTGLFACIPLIHVVIGILMASGSLADASQGSPPPPAIGWLFIIIGMGAILFGWTMALLVFFAGRKLHERKARMFCLVIAGLECMFMPFGTVLGVFTIIMLTKDSVIQLFDQNSTASHETLPTATPPPSIQ